MQIENLTAATPHANGVQPVTLDQPVQVQSEVPSQSTPPKAVTREEDLAYLEIETLVKQGIVKSPEVLKALNEHKAKQSQASSTKVDEPKDDTRTKPTEDPARILIEALGSHGISPGPPVTRTRVREVEKRLSNLALDSRVEKQDEDLVTDEVSESDKDEKIIDKDGQIARDLIKYLTTGGDLPSHLARLIRRDLISKIEFRKEDVGDVVKAAKNKRRVLEYGLKIVFPLAKNSCVINEITSGENSQSHIAWILGHNSSAFAFTLAYNKEIKALIKQHRTRAIPETKPTGTSTTEAHEPTLELKSLPNSLDARIPVVNEAVKKFSPPEAAKDIKVGGRIVNALIYLGFWDENCYSQFFYHLGQNPFMVRRQDVSHLLERCMSHPCHYFSCGVALNDEVLKYRTLVGRVRDWLMEDPNNEKTPFGKRFIWLLNGKKGDPPPPPFAETP